MFTKVQDLFCKDQIISPVRTTDSA